MAAAITVIAGWAAPVGAQSLRFTGFTQVSNGYADLEAGAVYLFADVAAGVDALVSIDFISPGALVSQIDNGGPPPPNEALYEYFQPKVQGAADQDHYADFTISFVDSTTGEAVSVGDLTMAVMDIDGNNQLGDTYERVTLYGLDAYRYEDGAPLADQIISMDPSEVQFESTAAGGPQGISLDPTYAVEADYSDVTSLSFRLGLTGTRSEDQTRLYSLNFYDTPLAYSSPTTVTTPEVSPLALLAVAGLIGARRRRS
ncbi:MAG: hypothetical protein HKN82_09255 [Akkermansiaceae bacterium]|nr:hypothetical protein [Akkermansiaceae bacterium]NNM28629.1 hypothetical protein [Akkermansiaceae bacterium]